MRIIYMGTPEIAATILKYMITRKEDEIVLVVTQPDRPKGRGKELSQSDVKKVALEYNIPVYQPEKIKNAESVAYLKNFNADMIVVAAFGQILSKEILELTSFGCLNVHASLLPKYRGAAPIQWSIIDGEEKTGITIMQMDEGLDTGDIILKKEIEIAKDETGGSLHDKLAEIGGEVLYEAIEQLKEGKATHTPQGEAASHYASMLNKKMGLLDFTKTADELDRLIRGLTPWPGSYTFIDGKMLKILKAETVASVDTAFKPGDVFEIGKNGFKIQTGMDALHIISVQPEGKRAMEAAEYVRGKDLTGRNLLSEK